MTNWKCKFCNRELVLKNKFTKSGHLARCNACQEWQKVTLTKEILSNLYVVQRLSLPDIAAYFGLDSCTMIYKALARCNIQARTRSQAFKEPGRQQKYKATCINKYGAENTFSKASTNRKIWQKRLFDSEGITNVFQRESVKRKSVESLIKNHGVANPGLLPKTGRTFTKIHKIAVDELNKFEIENQIEKKLLNTDRASKFSNYYYSYDIWIVGTNKLIEVNGDFWHANPRVYKENDIMICGSYRPLAKEIWEKDDKKRKLAELNGYTILVVWEWELKYNRVQELDRIIKWARS